MPLVILGTVGNFLFSQCRGSLNRGAVYIASDQLHNLLFSRSMTLPRSGHPGARSRARDKKFSVLGPDHGVACRLMSSAVEFRLWTHKGFV